MQSQWDLSKELEEKYRCALIGELQRLLGSLVMETYRISAYYMVLAESMNFVVQAQFNNPFTLTIVVRGKINMSIADRISTELLEGVNLIMISNFIPPRTAPFHNNEITFFHVEDGYYQCELLD